MSENNQTVETSKQFWSDDFDMDLLKIFPDLETLLGDPSRRLWTVGRQSHGRLNHPVTWNTHGAFLWTEEPKLERDAHGWFNVHGCTSNESIVECTWLEWLRDAWPHGYGAIILPSGVSFPPAPQADFHAIMYDLRGIRKTDVSKSMARAKRWIFDCQEALFDAVFAGSI